MFEEFMGIPAHPLLVHAAVVFVPLLAIVTVAYAFLPFARQHTRWVLGLLALATPVAALLAKLSGDEFFARLQRLDRVSDEFIPRLEEHQQLGTYTLYASIALGVVALALVFLVAPRAAAAAAAGGTGSNRVLSIVLGLVSLVIAGVSIYYVVRTGDSGAKAVWEGS